MNLEYLNKNYTQTGGVCVTATYGIILEYFSDGEYKIENFFEDYQEKLKPTQEMLDWSLENGACYRTSNNVEDLICAHFHYECIDIKKISGYRYIEELNSANTFSELKYCTIVDKKHSSSSIENETSIRLRKKLESGGLAMALYNTGSTYHSIVIGFDNEKNKYFKRDPQTLNIVYEDFLRENRITEYLLFAKPQPMG